MSNKKVHKLCLGKIREDQKSAGFFDGRFRTKSERNKKKYTRKIKHKNNDK